MREILPYFAPNGGIVTERLPYRRFRVSTPLVNVVVDTVGYPALSPDNGGFLVEFPSTWLHTDEERKDAEAIAIGAVNYYILTRMSMESGTPEATP